MKKRIIVSAAILLIIGLITGVCYGYHQWKKERDEKIEQMLLMIEYRRQNAAFGMSMKASETGYHGYEEIPETELYVRLSAYENWYRQKGIERPALTMEDVKDYFSSEYHPDGSLKVTNRPENIQCYMDWYSEDGAGEIKEYWVELGRISLDYYESCSRIAMRDRSDMNIEQLQELINKYNDPSYEINTAVMGEEE
ncbi:MAG: hypothetical protein NC089_00755 [Bacteroides sp.]|nr:hypothetical protein [Bacteroides sp.]MCM1551057.1 hypothetical protein [Clostridium sp.]